MDLASTTYVGYGKEFQTVTILLEKKFSCHS